MSPSDFFHPILGAVLRLDPGLDVEPVFPPSLRSTPGEWGGLQHANEILSRRFPWRKRMYMHHLPKSLSKHLVHEASVMFADDLTIAATRGFRESQCGEGDIEMAWLVTHLGIERWREALLWTWAVAKVGGEEGIWGDGARQEIRDLLHLESDDQREIVPVIRGERTTLEDIAEMSGQQPKHTQYRFCQFVVILMRLSDQSSLL